MERNDLIFKRIASLYQLFILVALCVIGRIVYLQFINPTDVKDTDISYRDEVIEAVRGDILAEDGRPLATSVPYYKIRIDCTVASPDTLQKYIDGLSKNLADFYGDRTARQYKAYILEGRRKGKRYLALGNRLIDYSELSQIKKFPLFNKGANRGGIIVEEKYKRNNPYGRLAYRTIGFINTEGTGVGIEGTWDYYLKGTPGHQIVQRMLGGEWIPVNTNQNIPPQDGYNIRTTINVDIQEAVENALRKQLEKGGNVDGATAIVMETKTGAIRAIANMKNDGKGGFDESYNYAIGEASEPGSVLKLVTLVSLLEDGYVTLDTPVDAGNGHFTYGGHVFSDSHGGLGMINVLKAFEHSSNVCFAKMAVQFYQNNPKKFVDRIQNMKLGERFHLDIQGEAAATIYSPNDAMWSASTLASMGFGYGMLITPLHTLTFYNAIANDGKMMKPYFIEDCEKDGEIVRQFKPQEISGSICSKETARTAKIALRGVVTEGTGRMLNNPNYEVSGKTGTARRAYGGKQGYEKNGMRRYQATFCGFFPSSDPIYTAIVILYSGDTPGNFYGASQAGPVFKQIADFIYANSPEWNKVLDGKFVAQSGRHPSIAKGRASASKIAVESLPIANKSVLLSKLEAHKWVNFKADSSSVFPVSFPIYKDSLVDVTDMGLKDAVFVLENQGYKVKFSGSGRIVAQSPASGTHAPKNTIINLQLTNNETR
ncbi:MAG: penicillin-binding protein [Bacteroidales bacterium]|nr:penicillin-binding protein [Bacteroidales bacterium]